MTRPNISKYLETKGAIMNSAFIESFKELIRMIVISMVSFFLTEGVVQFVLQWIVGDKLDVAQVLFITGLLTVILKSIDKFLHKNGTNTPLDLKVMDSLK